MLESLSSNEGHIGDLFNIIFLNFVVLFLNLISGAVYIATHDCVQLQRGTARQSNSQSVTRVSTDGKSQDGAEEY